ncbi:cupin domain-containing protein [Streptomyces sp. NPDC048196]|uniref:JmjC domain-containing protein n=1 Tax=Streptomyces sp. NPDC048196 TaxID=3154712 RepID=UPI0034080CFB
MIDAIDELHEPVADLAQHLEGWLRTHVQVNAYASWSAQEGFGTHWDDHDVIVVQVEATSTGSFTVRPESHRCTATRPRPPAPRSHPRRPSRPAGLDKGRLPGPWRSRRRGRRRPAP